MKTTNKEEVLVIPSDMIKFEGIINKNQNINEILEFAFIDTRPECETNYDLKQLVCYGFICDKDQIYMVKRLNKQSEERLHNLYSIGIGGHANPMNQPIKNALYLNMARELNEEMNVDFEDVSIDLFGYLNDNSNPVGKVHLGIVYRITVNNPNISIKETDKMEGSFISACDLHKYYPNMETWSQILCQNL